MKEAAVQANRGASRCMLVLAILLGAATLACVTPAEFRKLERRVIDMQRAGGATQERERLADQGAQLDGVEASVAIPRALIE